MLEDKYDWKISKADQNGNVYYHFPKDEDEFKEAVVKNGGMSVYVYQEGGLIDEFHTKSQGYRWTSPVFNYLKTMSKNGKYFYRYYKNCKFFAIPKNVFSKDDFKIIKDGNMLKSTLLNQILYGSPGTGKTYHTIDKALEILGENLKSRDEKKAKFDEYVKNGQIVFITFHQSYGYEEFVEGIKPMMSNGANSRELKYEIKDGVFKDICNKALENYENSNLNTEELREKIELREKVEKFLNRLLETNEPIGKTKGGNFFINSFNNNTIEIYSEDVERFDGVFKLSLSTFITLLKSNIELIVLLKCLKKYLIEIMLIEHILIILI